MSDEFSKVSGVAASNTLVNMQRFSGTQHQGSFSLNMRSSRKSVTGSMARAYKLAQYFRVLPCLYSEQIFCFAACLLKWFRLESTRQEALAASLVKGHHGDRQMVGVGQGGGSDIQLQKHSEDQDEPIEGFESHNREPIVQAVEPIDDEGEQGNKLNEAMDELPGEGQLPTEAEGEEVAEDEPTRSSDEQDVLVERPIYGNLNKSVLTRINYANARERRDTYKLAFSTMKYFSILDKLLEEIAFFLEYPDLKDEEYLVLVLAYDYAMRNFQRRVPLPNDRQLPTPERYFEYLPNNRLVLYPAGNELFTVAEAAVQAMCMRLAAAVARVRVRNQVGSLRLLLPEEWRSSEQMAEVMPTYGWYNQLLGKQDIVTSWLKDHGFRRIMAGRMPQPLEYASDRHCSDVFVFNKADVSNLLDSEIVQQKNLVLQDKSSCLGVHCCLANVTGGEEVLFVNCINVFSPVHMEGLIGNKFPLIQPVPQVRVIRQLKEEEDSRLTMKMGSKVIKASTEEFLSVEPNSEKQKSIRHIYIESSDSRSAVVNPVGFLEVEADDLSILKDMWTPPGNASKESRRMEMINKSSSLLRHALKFAGVRTVTFLSHSQDPDETDGLVAKVVDATNRLLLKEAEAIAASVRSAPTGTAFNPHVPTFPGLQEERDAYDAGKPSIITKNKTIRVPPSQETNGFYIVILHKEQILLKSADELRQEADQAGRGGKEAKGRGKGRRR
ncbi:putative methyltransferase nsun7 [Clonorchis sinensis]|uniref:Methyltransferase nsun7 n=1 Tax=Clonorchis sinensis TaxID=79923 RepID=A0A8T1MPI6_CLOSI|nr:putative methyltransferase nsun7 [Clonorchis sinensis]